jgi:hypothetical protein
MRLESDPEEVRQEEEAMAWAATPMHEQPTIEFDSREVLRGLGRLGEFGAGLDSDEWSAPAEHTDDQGYLDSFTA